MRKLRLAIVQINATTDLADNLSLIHRLVGRVHGADLIALPEVFALRGADRDYRKIAEPLDGKIATAMSRLALRKRSWLLAGSIIERSGRRVFNTSVLFDRSGRIAAAYRKMHLFEARLENGKHVREADAYSAGNKPIVCDIEGWRTGMAICYDLRFPELFRYYSKRGAKILFVPSNFTQRTGKDHWEALLRARAIENQCYVVAPDQCGINPATGIRSHGHSMVIGPWGEILCEAADRETVISVNLSPGVLETIRQRIPALSHRVM